MPSKYRIKEYDLDTYYHIYNRGVHKQVIFCDEQDFTVFLSYLKVYLEPKDEKYLQSVLLDPQVSWREKDKAIKLLRLNNFSDQIQLIAYCLMSNHFHLLIKQKDSTEMTGFMKSLCTRYTMYFNKKYKRVGSLFQDIYKAARVTSGEQLLYLTRYIHRNPIVNKQVVDLASQGSTLRSWSYSSYLEYSGKRFTKWISSDEILKYFSGQGFLSYESFVGDYEYQEKEVFTTSQIAIDEI